MKKRMIAVVAVLIILAGGYWLFDYYTGNHIAIRDVFNQSLKPANAGETLKPGHLNKNWAIDKDNSTVYFGVVTSREEVIFALNKVSGSWNFNLEEPDKMTASASADLLLLNSGNPARDADIRSRFNVTQYPKATFELTSVGDWPKQWVEGEPAAFKMNGKLTVSGVTKDVQFKSEGRHAGEELQLKGTTVVTFDDFGMVNPHTVLMDTQNDVTVSLAVVLKEQVSE